METDPNTELSRLIDGAGPIAGLFVLALGAVLVLLWFSLNRQMKKINPDLPLGRDDLEQAADAEFTAQAVARGATEEVASEPGADEQPPNP